MRVPPAVAGKSPLSCHVLSFGYTAGSTDAPGAVPPLFQPVHHSSIAALQSAFLPLRQTDGKGIDRSWVKKLVDCKGTSHRADRQQLILAAVCAPYLSRAKASSRWIAGRDCIPDLRAVGGHEADLFSKDLRHGAHRQLPVGLA